MYQYLCIYYKQHKFPVPCTHQAREDRTKAWPFAQRQKHGLDGRDIDALTLQMHAQQWLLDVLGPEHPKAGAFDAASESAAVGKPGADTEEQRFAYGWQMDVLCHLINQLHELISSNEAKHLTGEALTEARANPNSAVTGTIRIENPHSDRPFKKMENIKLPSSLQACKVPDEELFTTADLFHTRNIRNVVYSALSRRVQIIGSWKGPIMGEKWVEPEADPVPSGDYTTNMGASTCITKQQVKPNGQKKKQHQ